MFGGQVIRGAGFIAIVSAVATLLSEFGSGVVGVKTIAVFPMIAPLATEQFTRAMIVIIALVPGAIEAKVIVRLLPVPPHTPPPDASHDWKVVLAERTSVTVTEVAVPGPALVTIMVFVTFEPVSTGLGAMLTSTDKSAPVPPDTPPT